MISLEELYSRKCNTLVTWENLVDRLVLGIDFLKEMEEKIVKIKQNLNTTHDRKKSYADECSMLKTFKVWDHVLLKVKPKKSSLKLGRSTKLATRYCRPFEILDKVGSVAYMFTLSAMIKVHNVFHVSLLKKCVNDPNHVINWNLI
jgi:hypothetical protein